MPISEKIKGEVSYLQASADEKKLLMDILEVEDKGGFRYQADYQALINAYMNQHMDGDEIQ